MYDRHRDFVGSQVETKVGDTLYHTDSSFSRSIFGKVLNDNPLELTRLTHPRKFGNRTEYGRRERYYIDLSTGKPLYFELVPAHAKAGDKIPIENFELEERKEIERKSAESLEALTTALREQIIRKVMNSEKA